MENNQLIQPFGYTEMYEWVNVPTPARFGLFVQFSKHYPNKIEPFFNKDAVLAGVSTICSTAESDNPANWKYAYMSNEVGDVFLKKETLAVGIKQYDQHLEMAYISTRPYEHFVKVPNQHLDPNQQYVPRTNRQEWVRVALLGKTIVYDSGDITPGEFCMPYYGDDKTKFGTAVPWDGKSKYKFYVLDRLTDKTIMIVVNTFVTANEKGYTPPKKIGGPKSRTTPRVAGTKINKEE